MLRVIVYLVLATSLVADEPQPEIVKRGDEVHVPSPDCWSHKEYDFFATDKDGKKFPLPGILRGDQIYWKAGSIDSQEKMELPDGQCGVYLRLRGSKCLVLPWRIEVITPQYQEWNIGCARDRGEKKGGECNCIHLPSHYFITLVVC